MDRPYVFASRSPSRNGQQIGLTLHEEVSRLMFDPASNQAVIILHAKGQQLEPIIRVVRVQLKDGQTTAEIFPSAIRLTDYHSPTRRFLGATSFMLNPHQASQAVASEAARGASSQSGPLFGVWSQPETEFLSTGVWPALTGSDIAPREPEFLQFANADLAVLWGTTANIKVWNITEKRPQYIYQSAFISSPPALSPNGKYLGVQGEDGFVHILETGNGKLLGRLPAPGLDMVVFDPQGKYVAAASNQRVLVYDLEAGRVHRDIFLAHRLDTVARSQRLLWLQDGYLLAGDTHLIDIENATILWHYDTPGVRANQSITSLYGGRYWYLLESDDRSQIGLFHVQLPHPEALEASKSIDPEDMVLKPGVRVRLAITVNGTVENQSQVRADLTRKLEDNKMVVDDSSSLVLSASMKTGAAIQQTYNFDNGTSQTVTSTPQIASLTLSDGTDVVWQEEAVVGGHIPPVIALEKGQSAQDYINAISAPNYDYFNKMIIPPRLSKSPPEGVYGFSVLTKNGIEKSPPPPATTINPSN